MTGLISYGKKLTEHYAVLSISAVGSFILSWLIPCDTYMYAALAVLAVMVLDIFTKLFALSRQSKGFWKAIKGRSIKSNSLFKGTIDKLIVFFVMLVICSFAYRMTELTEVANWFTQFVFSLMFLRDTLSIIENLIDAGVSGLDIFKKVLKKKYEEVTGEPSEESEEK